MATEADLIQKFKDLNIPVGADFEELIHAAFVGANLVDKVDSKADDSKVVHNTGAEEISGQKTFDVAPIDKTTGNPYITRDGVPTIDLSNYPTKDQLATKSDDSKVAHLSGANNFDTVPTVNNNPLLLASGLPSTLADTTKLSNFTAGLQKGGADVATQSDVTTAVSTATANMVDSSKPTNFTAGLQSGGVNVATAADLKSVEDQAWRQLENSKISSSNGSINHGTYVLYRLDTLNKRLFFVFTISTHLSETTVTLDFSSVVSNISNPSLPSFYNWSVENSSNVYTNITVSGNLLKITLSGGGGYISSLYSLYDENGVLKNDFCFVNYDNLV